MVWRPLGSRGGLRLLWPLRALALPALPVLALPVLALLRRECRFPGAAAADRRVGRLRDLLWGGASAMAVPALQALVDAPVGSGVDQGADLAADRGATFRINPFRINPQWARLQAALALAAWWDFHGDTNRALQLLEALGTCPAAIRQRPERIIPLAVLLQRSGQIGAAQQLLAPQVMANNPHAALACANLVADPATRLARINRIYTDRGFMPLVMADPLGVLSLDQLRGTPPQPPGQIPDQISGQIRVSVILPAYQAQDCIATALRSLCAQTHAALEIIVVDDASTDRTAAIVTALAQADPRIVLLRQAQNGGAYAARNCGLHRATGQLITTHDADDWSHPQKLETQVRFLAADPARMAVLTHWARCDPALQFTTNWRLSPRLIDWSHSSLMFRRSVSDRLGGWEPVRVAADTEFIWRIEAAYGRPVPRIHPDLPLAFARDAIGSLTRHSQTHARTIYYGLRHYYREISRYWHDRYPQGLPPAAQAQKMAMLPAAMFGPKFGPEFGPEQGLAPPAALHAAPPVVLCGDLGNPAVIARARHYLDRHSGQYPGQYPAQYPGQSCGIAHVPDPACYRRTTTHAARFCDGAFALLGEGRVTIVLPGAAQPDMGPDMAPGMRLIDLNTPGVNR